MFYNRLRSAAPAKPIADPSPSPQAFLLCPAMGLPVQSVMQWQWQQQLYAWALAQAQAVVRPSLPVRLSVNG